MADSVVPVIEGALQARGWLKTGRKVRKFGGEPVGVTLLFEREAQKLTVTILSKATQAQEGKHVS